MSDHPFVYVDYQVDRQEKIATVTFTNPAKHNAAPWWAEEELVAAIDAWERDDDVKAVIIRGTGEHFCAGHDVGAYLQGFKVDSAPGAPKRRPTNREQLLVERNLHQAKQRLFYSLKPTIAQISGQCIEWGNQIQVCCDISIAAEDAHLGNLGQAAGMAGINIIRIYAELVGFKRMREMMVTGRTISGRDAALIGLVNRAVRPEHLEDEVRTEARRIALLPLDGIVTGKAYTNAVYDSMGLGKAFSEVTLGHVLGLKIRVEEDEFSFFRELRNHGTSHAVRQRQARYEPLGGFGQRAERPIVPDDRAVE